MGNRLSKIVTKTGDDGCTGLAGQQRISKADTIIDAIGDIDEFNSAIGWVRVVNKDKELDQEFNQLQHNLFNVGGDLCLLGSVLITAQQIEEVDLLVEKYNQHLSSLTNFILPTGSEITARLHMARSVCRRAERSLVRASQSHEFNPLLLAFVNRLSDWLFVLARYTDETKEELWC